MYVRVFRQFSYISKCEEDHLKHLKAVFQIIKENGLKINIEKCHFFMKEVEVLGHLLTTKGIKPVPSKIEAIRHWEKPKNISELRSFLGTVGYYRKFIPNFARVVQSLYKLLRKNEEFSWNQECQGIFNNIKEFLIQDPLLKF